MGNENLPINVDDGREDGTIFYANEVIAIIAGMAANEVDGVATMTNAPGSIADLFVRSKPVTRGVKVEVGTEEASIDLVLTVEYGKPIQKVCVEVQENVRKAIETMTGLHVLKVDVHVIGVSFERETQQMAQGYVKATQDAALDEVAGAARRAEKPAMQEAAPAMDDDEIDVDIPEGPEDDDEDEGEDDAPPMREEE